MAIGDSEHEVFLGREIGHRHQVSEDVQQNVDREVKRLLDEAYVSAFKVLEQNRHLLERIAEALLERETLDREDIDTLATGQALPEAKVVREARAVAESLRKEKTGSLAAPSKGPEGAPRLGEAGGVA
jgi:cell division protease FtsH